MGGRDIHVLCSNLMYCTPCSGVRAYGRYVDGGRRGEGRDGMRRDDNESRGMFGFGDWGGRTGQGWLVEPRIGG